VLSGGSAAEVDGVLAFEVVGASIVDHDDNVGRGEASGDFERALVGVAEADPVVATNGSALSVSTGSGIAFASIWFAMGFPV
jgi:hypothetical protein